MGPRSMTRTAGAWPPDDRASRWPPSCSCPPATSTRRPRLFPSPNISGRSATKWRTAAKLKSETLPGTMTGTLPPGPPTPETSTSLFSPDDGWSTASRIIPPATPGARWTGLRNASCTSAWTQQTAQNSWKPRSMPSVKTPDVGLPQNAPEVPLRNRLLLLGNRPRRPQAVRHNHG